MSLPKTPPPVISILNMVHSNGVILYSRVIDQCKSIYGEDYLIEHEINRLVQAGYIDVFKRKEVFYIAWVEAEE